MVDAHAVGIYADEAVFLAACRAARAKGLTVEAYTPWPVHGLEDALGLSRSLIGRPVFALIIVGCVLAFMMQYHLQVIDWPVIYSGKPFMTWPLWVVATLETGLLLGAVTNMLLCFQKCSLFPDPAPQQPDPRVTDDRFALVATPIAGESLETTAEWLRAHGAERAEVRHG